MKPTTSNAVEQPKAMEYEESARYLEENAKENFESHEENQHQNGGLEEQNKYASSSQIEFLDGDSSIRDAVFNL